MNPPTVVVPSPTDSLTQSKRRPVIAKVRLINARCQIAVAPDSDVDGWRRQLRGLFATSSPLFVDASLKQLMAACKLPGEVTPSTTSVSAALELIASLRPENEAQAALAIHIASLHAASINVLGRLHGITERNVISMATAAAKLELAYQRAIETYHRLKNGNTQIVRIEKVEVQPGGQAVVGALAGPR